MTIFIQTVSLRKTKFEKWKQKTAIVSNKILEIDQIENKMPYLNNGRMEIKSRSITF